MPIIIRTADELSQCVRAVDGSQGMVERHAAMTAFHFELDTSRLKDCDPYSREYEQRVLSLYKLMHAADYSTDSESQVLDYELRNPTPFPSHSPHLIGSHFGSIATILRDFPVAPPARVLDVGVGWGHTSLMLARSGFQVDAVDINEDYLRLVEHWAERMHVSERIKTMSVPFADFSSLRERYDAILFFESFHHAIGHSRLVRDCLRLLNPDGAIVFAGEPVHPQWGVPWCIRSDSLSAYCIHKFGWMELGFDEDYFLEMLMRNGMWVAKRTYVDFPTANGYVARRAQGLLNMDALMLPSHHDATWHQPEAGMRWTRGSSTLPGSLASGSHLQFHVVNHSDDEIDVDLLGDDATVARSTISGQSSGVLGVALKRRYDRFTIKSKTWSPSRLGSTDTRELGVAVRAVVV